ncbi:MAG: addiction module antidote protein [Sneathiella sp.]
MELTDFDIADYLDDEEAIALYLSDVLETGDVAYLSAALGKIAKSKGMTEIAKKTGVKREALYRALSEKGNPQFKTVSEVIKAMGFQLSVQPIGDGEKRI